MPDSPSHRFFNRELSWLDFNERVPEPSAMAVFGLMAFAIRRRKSV